MSNFHKTTCLLAVSLAISLQGHGREIPSAAVAEAEAIYADLADSYGVISTIDSGLFRTYEAKDRAAWERVYGEKRNQLADKLSRTSASGLSPLDARALDVMNRHLRDDFPEQFKDESAPPEHCQDAQHQNLSMSSLEGALYACFTELGNNLEFEGQRVTRVSAFGMLEEMSEEARRQPERRDQASRPRRSHPVRCALLPRCQLPRIVLYAIQLEPARDHQRATPESYS